MSPTTTFLIGLFVGSWMGLLSAALAATAKHSDRRWYD